MVVVDPGNPDRRGDRRDADGTLLRKQEAGEKVVGGMKWIILVAVLAIVGVTGFLVGFAYGQEHKE